MTFRILLLIFFWFTTSFARAQEGSLRGWVYVEGEPMALATVTLQELSLGTTTNNEGEFHLSAIPGGTYRVIASYVGYEPVTQKVTFSANQLDVELHLYLQELSADMQEIVVTATKTARRKMDVPVVVSVLSAKTLSNVQACNMAEGLRFQTGLRVESNCQTCNYTQLRMNGLGGGYSQILINGRPIFSPLMGLYGMEQLPATMIERIEVVRGGGSSLYGSSAIGGTVNVITKIPEESRYELGGTYYWINGKAGDWILNGNFSLVSENKKFGGSLFVNHRDRDFYDHNGDNFSEIPKLQNTSFGASLYFLLGEHQKININLSNLNEYRFGGDMVAKPAYLSRQAEERTHKTWMGSIDYTTDFNRGKTALTAYAATQQADRKHYTGSLPDDARELQNHLANPPYGVSTVATYNVGIQVDHTLDHFLKGKNVLTLGSEYVNNGVKDEIQAYRYAVDQTTGNLGIFLQSDWNLYPFLTLLAGVRMDWHNRVDKLQVNPRASLLYTYKKRLQFRLNYGSGFRAPQAFDADLHIAMADGGVSRVSIAADLLPETSQSVSSSVYYRKIFLGLDVDMMLEGFYTRLIDAFYLQPVGQDKFGLLFEKQNGTGAMVQGITIELSANYKGKIDLESGFTLQTSRFDNPVKYLNGLQGTRDFSRTPNNYGFAILSFVPIPSITMGISYLYTGGMGVPHAAGAPNQTVDEMYRSEVFSEVGVKMSYLLGFKKLDYKLEFYSGVKNLLNAYQHQFDIGKNRDSNFIFGPAQPRTFYVGVKFRSG